MAKKEKPSGLCIICGSSDWCDCEWDQAIPITQQEWEQREEAKRMHRQSRRIADEAQKDEAEELEESEESEA